MVTYLTVIFRLQGVIYFKAVLAFLSTVNITIP